MDRRLVGLTAAECASLLRALRSDIDGLIDWVVVRDTRKDSTQRAARERVGRLHADIVRELAVRHASIDSALGTTFERDRLVPALEEAEGLLRPESPALSLDDAIAQWMCASLLLQETVDVLLDH